MTPGGKAITELLAPADALLVIPPFTDPSLAVLGPHILQAEAEEAGFAVSILYAGLVFAQRIGVAWYESFCRDLGFDMALPGERIFHRHAHDGPPLGRNVEWMYEPDHLFGPDFARQLHGMNVVHPGPRPTPLEELEAAERLAAEYLADVADAIVAIGYPVVGCSCSFAQVNASLALLRAVKRRRPTVVTAIGGASCHGEMALGIASLDPDSKIVDHIFSGESETTWVEFLTGVKGQRQAPRHIWSCQLQSPDDIACPKFDDFRFQIDSLFPDGRPLERRIVMEAGRGCLRGARGHCTFCGLNGESRTYRPKSTSRTVAELRAAAQQYPGQGICFSDNLLSTQTIRALADARVQVSLQGCIAGRITEEHAATLKRAGLSSVTPGIEALDSRLLELMNKGTTAADTVTTLRLLRAAGVPPLWNLLWGFPGDDAQSYVSTAKLLPALRHLQPPYALIHVSIDRASPYFQRPDQYQIRSVRPLPACADVYPATADIGRLGWHNIGEYDCGAYQQPDAVRTLRDELDTWLRHWSAGPCPNLTLLKMGQSHVLADTRGLDGLPVTRTLTAEQAKALVSQRPLDTEPWTRQALDESLALALDGQYIPLAIVSGTDMS